MTQGLLPSNDDRLLMSIAKDMADHWHEVSIQLGLPNTVVESIIGQFGSDSGHMKGFKLLQEWKRRASDDFTYHNLALALEESGLISIAKKYCYDAAAQNED